MKLFIYDQKHEKINATLDLGEVDALQLAMVDKITKFLEEQHLTNRYCNLIVAESFSTTYEDGIPTIHFQYD